MLKNRHHPDLKDSYGRTPLSWAAEKGHREVVEMLLAKGVDPDSRNKDGWTPLSWAAGKGHREVVEMLLAKGVDPDSRDMDGWTPLLWAARSGHEEIVEMLLAKDGVDPNSKDTLDGRTPLFWAARNGHKEIVEMLLAKDGVDPDPKDNDSRTPLPWTAMSWTPCGQSRILTLQDYQMQLMLLEQRKKRDLMMARPEQDGKADADSQLQLPTQTPAKRLRRQ